MKYSEFISWDFLASCLYIFPFFGLGFFFSHLLTGIFVGFTSIKLGLKWFLLLALTLYLIYRLRNYNKSRRFRDVPRIHADALAEKLSTASGKEMVVVADTRSHGYYDAGAMRIPGSIRLEPNLLPQEIQRLPRGKEIYLYCT